jgi:hypothetical protein
MQQYFQNMMGINDRGVGASQHMYDSGQNAATNIGGFWNSLNSVLGKMYDSQGKAQAGSEMGRSDGIYKLISSFI